MNKMGGDNTTQCTTTKPTPQHPNMTLCELLALQNHHCHLEVGKSRVNTAHHSTH